MATVRRSLVLTVALLLVFQAEAVERSELTPLPLPDLSAMEDATRRRLEELQERTTVLNTTGTDGELADAFGILGTYYLAHYLLDAAEVSFANASRL